MQVPFESYFNLILLRVRVNDSEPLQFILDTGASLSTISEKRAKAIGLMGQGKQSVEGLGMGEGSIDVSFAKRVKFGLGDANLLAKLAAIIPLDWLEKVIGHSVDGVLGYDLFSRYVVEINYEKRLVTLHEPKSYKYAGSGETMPLLIRDKTPLVKASVKTAKSRALEALFVLDTGNGGGLSLNGPFVKKNNILSGVPRTTQIFGAGVDGGNRGLAGRVESFQFGHLTVTQPIFAFSNSAKGKTASDDFDGNIGGGFLERFNVIFDYSRRQMTLEPNAHFSEPYEGNMSGMFLLAEGQDYNSFRVERLATISPAAEAGIREGDIITSIDDQPATTLTLDELNRLFKIDGREYSLNIKRGAQSLHVKMKLKRLI